MSRIYADNAHSIGNTPLVQINRIAPRGVTILAKIEGRNPGYSVKCRIGANMIWDAESSGRLKPGMTIVEPTSGNTGIGLAFVAAARGYKLMLTMPASMSIERRKVLNALGAELVLTEPAKGMKGAIAKAEELLAGDPETFFMPAQFDNPANPAIHEKTTGPEIWADTDGTIDVLVAGVGTGGTITGISRYIKHTAGKPILSVAVEPDSSPIITQAMAGEEITPAPHKIQGIGAGFIPKNLDLSIVDRVERVTDDESKAMARRLMQEEGILCGISCGAAMAAAVRLAEKPEMQGKTVVLLLDASGPIALFAVADTVKETSREAIAQLHELGIKTVMLTGDNPHTAKAIADQVGIDEAQGNLLPADKLSAIEALYARNHRVGMVGDGINDAPALARAEIGFAMAAAGTDTAIETADVALMDDDLRKIPTFIRLSRQTSAVLKQNIILAIATKVLFIGITFAGLATMWMAVFADMGVSLLVVFNGLRLLKK
ncbi:cysteine synthase A [Pseudomonas syringae pv. actinidiae]|nr:cysteine synthase A [Pseudomonas syringae pv. actinidiae]